MTAASRWRLAACALLAAIPWLWPFAPGPTASAVPALASMACIVALWSVAGWPAPGRGLLLLLAAPLLWALLAHFPPRPELVFLSAGLAVVALAAGVGRAGGAIADAVQRGWIAAAVASALVALCQYFGVAAAFSPWMNTGAVGEAYANLRQPNQFASLCGLGAAVLVLGRVQLPRAAAVATIALLAGACAASASRTGLMQGLLLAALAALWRGPGQRRRLELCAWGGAAYLLATLGLPLALETVAGVVPERTVWGRFVGGAGCSSRWVLWDNVLRLVALRPLAGWGWGELDYAHFITLYPGARFCDILDNAHSLPLHLAVELGLPAAIVICGGVLWWVARRQPWRETEPLRQLAWAVLGMLLLHSLLEYPLWYGPFQIAAGVALGWLLAPSVAAVRSRAGPAAAALLAAAIAYAAWDYARVSQVYVEPEQRISFWREDTMEHARRSWLFGGPARFAELTLASLSPANAAWMSAGAEAVLHYSPEPRVIERAIESATMQGRYDEAVLHLARYRAAFPADYQRWRAEQQRPILK